MELMNNGSRQFTSRQFAVEQSAVEQSATYSQTEDCGLKTANQNKTITLNI